MQQQCINCSALQAENAALKRDLAEAQAAALDMAERLIAMARIADTAETKLAQFVGVRAACQRAAGVIARLQDQVAGLEADLAIAAEERDLLAAELEQERAANAARDFTALRHERQLTLAERQIQQRDALWDAQQTVVQVANRVANAAQGLVDNPHWDEGLKATLRWLVAESGYALGDEIAERGPLLYLMNPERLARAGMSRTTVDKWLGVLEAGGYVGRTLTTPVGEGRPYYEWYLIGAAVNALWPQIATAPLPEPIRAKREEIRQQAVLQAQLTREKHEQMERELAQVRFEKTDLEIALHDTQQALQRQQPTQESLQAELAAARRTIRRLSFCGGCGAALTEEDRRCAACRAAELPAHVCTCHHPAELFQGFGKYSADDEGTEEQPIKDDPCSSNVPEPGKNSPADGERPDLQPCRSCRTALTPQGCTCRACNERFLALESH